MVSEKINQRNLLAKHSQKIFSRSFKRRLYIKGILFDLTKAYNAINHDILFDKLNNYGISGITNYGLNPIYLISHNLLKQFKLITKISIKIHTYLNLGQRSDTRVNFGTSVFINVYK
jgi:hypothetical protein